MRAMTGTGRGWTIVALTAIVAACDGSAPVQPTPRAVDAAPARESRSLHGRVTRSDGTPLAGAVVRAEPSPIFVGVPDRRTPVEATAAADGAFELPGVDDGDWSVTCTADGAWRLQQGVVRLPDVRRFDVVLPPGPVFEGSLVDDETGKPMSGAKVQAYRDGRVIAEVVTSADGRFAFDLHRPYAAVDEYRLEAPGYGVHPAGFSMGCVIYGFAAGDRVPLAFRARRGPTVRGTVTGPAGPVAGADVDVWFTMYAPGEGGGTPTTKHATTDAAGAYEFVGVEGGACVIRATASGLVQAAVRDAGVRDPRAWPSNAPDACCARVPDEGGASAQLRHDVTLVAAKALPRRKIHGLVHDAAGAPLGAADVRAGLSFEFAETTTAADGTFAVEAPVDADVVWVSASRAGHVARTKSLDMSSEDAEKPVDLELSADPVIRGRVADAKGAPVADARVVVVPAPDKDASAAGGDAPPLPETPPAEVSSDADGRFSLRLHRTPAGDALVATATGFAPRRVEIAADDSRAEIEATIVLASLHDLSGRVVRGDTHEPAVGVCVAEIEDGNESGDDAELRRAGRVLATTSADGSFRIAGIGAGVRSLYAFGNTWLPRRFAVEIPLVATVRVEIDPSLTLAGRFQFDDGSPTSGVEVSAFDHPRGADGSWGDQAGRQTQSRADGRFAIAGLRPVPHWIMVRWGEPQIVEANIGPFTPDAGVERPIRVVRGATIVGRLVDLQGLPILATDSTCEPEVRATPSDGQNRPDGRGWVQSGEETGAFSVGGLDHGAYDLVVHARGYVPIRMKNVRADAGPLVLKLDPGLALSGVVLDVDGKPLSRVTIVATPEDPAATDDDARRSCDTDVRGWFRISGLPQGRWRLDLFRGVTFDGKRRLSGDTEFDAGADDVVLRCVAVSAKSK
jgi:protocatechuate 3,4-dioxygenase beta subunit